MRRLLAVVALGSLVAALLVLLVGVIANLGAVLVALAGSLVAVVGSWDWLTRTGRPATSPSGWPSSASGCCSRASSGRI